MVDKRGVKPPLAAGIPAVYAWESRPARSRTIFDPSSPLTGAWSLRSQSLYPKSTRPVRGPQAASSSSRVKKGSHRMLRRVAIFAAAVAAATAFSPSAVGPRAGEHVSWARVELSGARGLERSSRPRTVCGPAAQHVWKEVLVRYVLPAQPATPAHPCAGCNLVSSQQ